MMDPLGVTQHYLGDLIKRLPTPEREQTTNQSKDTTKVQFGEPMGLWRSATGVWVRGTYRNRTAHSVTKSLPQPEWQGMNTGALVHTSWSVFWATWLTCPSAKQLHLLLCPQQFLLIITLGGRNPAYLVSFRDFLRLTDEPHLRIL